MNAPKFITQELITKTCFSFGNGDFYTSVIFLNFICSSSQKYLNIIVIIRSHLSANEILNIPCNTDNMFIKKLS